jgi:hypothetical protein
MSRHDRGQSASWRDYDRHASAVKVWMLPSFKSGGCGRPGLDTLDSRRSIR